MTATQLSAAIWQMMKLHRRVMTSTKASLTRRSHHCYHPHLPVPVSSESSHLDQIAFDPILIDAEIVGGVRSPSQLHDYTFTRAQSQQMKYMTCGHA
jgi:hypothetical protein